MFRLLSVFVFASFAFASCGLWPVTFCDHHILPEEVRFCAVFSLSPAQFSFSCLDLEMSQNFIQFTKMVV